MKPIIYSTTTTQSSTAPMSTTVPLASTDFAGGGALVGLPLMAKRALLVREMTEAEVRAMALNQGALIDEQNETIAALRRELEHSRATCARLTVEVRARSSGCGHVPRTVGGLRVWREERDLTQAAAAKLLGVKPATIKRAEEGMPDSPLTPPLRQAFERHARSLSAAEDDAQAATARDLATAIEAKYPEYAAMFRDLADAYRQAR